MRLPNELHTLLFNMLQTTSERKLLLFTRPTSCQFHFVLNFEISSIASSIKFTLMLIFRLVFFVFVLFLGNFLMDCS